MKKLLMVLSMVLTGCATGHQLKTFETDRPSLGQAGDRTIVLDKDGRPTLQKVTFAATKYNTSHAVNVGLENTLTEENAILTRCRVETADPRLGGSGEYPEIIEVDGLKTVEAIKEELGLTKDGQLIVFEESSFERAWAIEKDFEVQLRAMMKVVVKQKNVCEEKMKPIRIAHGLPPERFQGEIRYEEDGSWVQVREHEHNLSDGFRIAKMLAQKNSGK